MSVSFERQIVLLVDDEASSRALVGKMLQRMGFADVLIAEDGFKAVDILNARRDITAVVTDFRMPGLHGLQLLKMIRTGQTTAPRNIVCALLTSYAERHLVGLAIVLDVDTFLAKPVSPETLSKHLGRCFQYRFEPLPVATYDTVDVDNAAPHLSLDEAPPASKPSAPPYPPAPTDPAPTAEFKQVGPPQPAPAEPVKGEPPTPSPEAKPHKKVALADVPENATLARDLVGAGGTLLLAAGTQFKARYAKRLEELSGIREKVEYAWIVDE